MADASPDDRRPAEARAFRWHALIQHSPDALFLLNQHRRILTVNPAWETLTGISLSEARGLVCRRQTESGPLDLLAAALAPPAEVFEGKTARPRRPVIGLKREKQWWDVDFLPLQDGRGRTRILGKITPAAVENPPRAIPFPEKLAAVRERLDQRFGLDTLASTSLVMRRVADQVRLAGQTRSPVLIVGEPGTGKQWVSRVIHHNGAARERSYAALDCAHLPAPSLEEALFGPAGLFLHPNLGTLYLREITRLPRDLQARLCERMENAVPGGPRIVAGTSSDPAVEIRAQRWLDRFHAVLSTLVIELPPLRERSGDIKALAEKSLTRLNSMGTKRVNGLTPDAERLLAEYDWPGNLRELNAVISSAWRGCRGLLIDVAQLPRPLRLRLAVEQASDEPAARTLPLASLLEEVERRLLVFALRRTHGNKSKAAKLLEIWRPHLIRRMEKLGIKNPGTDAPDTPE